MTVEDLEGIYDFILEIVLCRNSIVLIALRQIPQKCVICNIKKYLPATLFNAPTTISGYYQAEVNYDMPQFAHN